MIFDDRWNEMYPPPQMPGSDAYGGMGPLAAFNPLVLGRANPLATLADGARSSSQVPVFSSPSAPARPMPVTGSAEAGAAPAWGNSGYGMPSIAPGAPAAMQGLLSAPANAPTATWPTPAEPTTPMDYKPAMSMGAELFKAGAPKEQPRVAPLQAAPAHVPQGVPLPVLYQLLMQKGVA